MDELSFGVGAERTFDKAPSAISDSCTAVIIAAVQSSPSVKSKRAVKLLKRSLNRIVSRARIQKSAYKVAPPDASMLGYNNRCHWSWNRTVQRAPGVRSTLKLPPSRCANALTNPRPDKRLRGTSKSKPNPSSCTQSSYSPGRRLKPTVTVTCPCWLPPYFAAFISSSLMINASGIAVSFGRFPLAVLQSIDTSLPNRVRALAQIAVTRSCPLTSVEPRAQ